MQTRKQNRFTENGLTHDEEQIVLKREKEMLLSAKNKKLSLKELFDELDS